MTTDTPQSVSAILRAPFPASQINKLPGRGGSPALDYVGHAAATARLLDADPAWTWEPMALDEHGLPAFDRDPRGQPIGLWIRLTVGGVTRPGYGDAGGKSGANAIKEIIGDALRNAGMRFGVALDLWHKGALHSDGERVPESREQARPTARQPAGDPLVAAKRAVVQAGDTAGLSLTELRTAFTEWTEGGDLATADLGDLGRFAEHLLAVGADA